MSAHRTRQKIRIEQEARTSTPAPVLEPARPAGPVNKQGVRDLSGLRRKVPPVVAPVVVSADALLDHKIRELRSGLDPSDPLATLCYYALGLFTNPSAARHRCAEIIARKAGAGRDGGS